MHVESLVKVARFPRRLLYYSALSSAIQVHFKSTFDFKSSSLEMRGHNGAFLKP